MCALCSAGWGTLWQLKSLLLRQNKLSGPLPAFVTSANCTQCPRLSLSWLDLADNQLTGTLPTGVRVGGGGRGWGQREGQA